MAKKKLDAAGNPLPPQPTDRSTAQSRMALKKKIRFFYDIQRLRLQTSGRLYKRPEGVTIDLHPVDVQVLETRAADLEKAEKAALSDIKDHLKTIPFYAEVLSDKSQYKGIGPTMAGVILSEFDIVRQETASQCWSYAGLAPIPAHRCKKCHAVVEGSVDIAGGMVYKHTGKTECATSIYADQVYASGKTMRPTKGEKLPYNAFLKTKLVGVLGPVLLQLKSPLREYYDAYKHRKQSEGWGRSDAHRHQAAIRYMIKMVLLKIWKDWRTFENLPVRPSYQEEKLHHTHTMKPVNQVKSDPVEDVPPEVTAMISAEAALADE